MAQVLLILSVLPFICWAQTPKQIETAKKIKEYYIKSTSYKDSLNFQKLFFDGFPGNFDDFVAIFGWHYPEDTARDYHGGPLYDGHKEISLLFRLKIIPEKILYQKIIKIAIDGKWQADAVNYLQNGLQKKAIDNPQLIFDLLKDKPHNDIKSFWFFFFNEIHPVYEIIPEQLKKMKSYDGKIYALMEKGHADALKKSGH